MTVLIRLGNGDSMDNSRARTGCDYSRYELGLLQNFYSYLSYLLSLEDSSTKINTVTKGC